MDKFRDLIYNILISKDLSGQLKKEQMDAEYIDRTIEHPGISDNSLIISFEPFVPDADNIRSAGGNLTKYAAASEAVNPEQIPQTGISRDNNYALLAEIGKDGNTILYLISAKEHEKVCILYCSQTLMYYPLVNNKFDLGIIDDFSFDKFSIELLFPSAVIDVIIKNYVCTFIDENSMVENYIVKNGEVHIKIITRNKNFKTVLLISGSTRKIIEYSDIIIIPPGLIRDKLKLLFY